MCLFSLYAYGDDEIKGRRHALANLQPASFPFRRLLHAAVTLVDARHVPFYLYTVQINAKQNTKVTLQHNNAEAATGFMRSISFLKLAVLARSFDATIR